MIDDSGSVPAVVDTARRRISTIAELAAISEEEIWLSEQKSARTRRAYRLDVQHFIRTLSVATVEERRQADHKAVIAWERYMREVEHAASPTIRRGLATLSSLYKHLFRHSHAPRNPVGEVERPAINRDEGTDGGLLKRRRRANCSIFPVRKRSRGYVIARSCQSGCKSQVGLHRAEIAALKAATCTRTAATTRCAYPARAVAAMRWRSTHRPRRIWALISKGPGTAPTSTGLCSGR
jgi:hypothetical protein